MCMRAVSVIKGDQPQLSLRIGKNTDNKIWDEAVNLISQGMGFPALFNDEIAIAAKMKCGISKSDAYNYAVMGCVELCIPGKEYAHTEGARLNWAKVLEELLNDIKDNKIDRGNNSFDRIYELYKNIYMTEQKSYVILLILQVGCFRGSGLFRLLVL